MSAIIDAAVTHARTVVATLILVLIAGSYAYYSVPKEADPDIDIPTIYVNLSHEGISPEDAERLLIKPMEEEFRSIEGVKEMRATGYQGGANVLLEFEAGFDADTAIADVREKVDLAKPELPEDSDEPTVHEINLALFPVLVVTLSGDLPERTLLRLARNLQDKVEGVSSVLDAQIAGDREELVELVVNPLVLESYGLDARDIIDAVSRSNRLVAAGSLDTGQGRFAVKVPGLFENATDILDMPVKVSDDAVVRFRDIGMLRRTFKDPEGFARINGQPALALEIRKRTGENIIDTVDQVRAIVEAQREVWPEEVKVNYGQDKSTNIKIMLSDLQNNVLSAVLLVMVVIVAALGLRSAGLVGVAIPGSFLTGILVLASIAFQWTRNAAVAGQQSRLLPGMLITGVLTTLFVIGQWRAWQKLNSTGQGLRVGPANAFFFFLDTYLLTKFKFSTLQNSMALVVFGASMAFGSAYLTAPLHKRFSKFSVLYVSIAAMALGIFAFMINPIENLSYVLVVPITIAFAVMYPTMLSLFSGSVGPSEQGWVMGVTVAIYALGSGTVTALSGSLMVIDLRMPFMLGIGCGALALIFMALLFRNPEVRKLDTRGG